ncbi:hypothetical protein [Actinacidiphila glaucinigra]|uniref:Uncharacterized protein n=1 Tax=Actinacidiphila glaucinigra TaxID=235986 RepID=A0A239EZ64_9ACTN|nr:hypothetical protein [Actinacidiphila glaucinigra]SNS50040.1 hypothetical protein SAMN05216252_106234 [Actinacidiphila glaucinigra]
MTPSVNTPGSIAFESIQTAARAVLAITREVDKWREDYDPMTDEWHTLLNLSEAAAKLAFALPVEMLPPEEVRHVSEYELRLSDELLALFDAIETAEG